MDESEDPCAGCFVRIRSVFHAITDSNIVDAREIVPYFEIEVTQFNEAAAEEFEQRFQDLYRSGRNFIIINIHSPGGSVFALNRMLDCVSKAKAAGITVVTTCRVFAASCGAILLAMGSIGHRYCGEHGKVLIHNISSGTEGSLYKMTADIIESISDNRVLFRKIANNAELDDVDFYFTYLKDSSKDQWLHPSSALRLKLVDQIGMPSVVREVKNQYTLGSIGPYLSEADIEKMANNDQGSKVVLQDEIVSLPTPETRRARPPNNNNTFKITERNYDGHTSPDRNMTNFVSPASSQISERTGRQPTVSPNLSAPPSTTPLQTSSSNLQMPFGMKPPWYNQNRKI